MKYITEFINSFLRHFVAGVDSIYPTLSTLSYASASETTMRGTTLIDENENENSTQTLLGTGLIITGSAVSNAVSDTDKLIKQEQNNLRNTEAYVQSMNEEELFHLINQLEAYQNQSSELIFPEDCHKQPKVLSKSFRKN